MSRTLNDGIKNVLAAAEIQPFFAVQIFFDTETIYAWTGLGDLIVDGITYIGTGQFLQISEITETAEISAKGATVSLSGVPSNLLSLALSEPYQGRLCKIFFGAIDANKAALLLESGSLILSEDTASLDISDGNPNAISEVFTGYIDQMNIEEGPETSIISMSVESKLIDLERSRIFRYTDQSQKSRYPNDKGLEFVEDLQDKQFSWGRG